MLMGYSFSKLTSFKDSIRVTQSFQGLLQSKICASSLTVGFQISLCHHKQLSQSLSKLPLATGTPVGNIALQSNLRVRFRAVFRVS